MGVSAGRRPLRLGRRERASFLSKSAPEVPLPLVKMAVALDIRWGGCACAASSTGKMADDKVSDRESDLQYEWCPHLFFLGDTILERIVCGGAFTSPGGRTFAPFDWVLPLGMCQ